MSIAEHEEDGDALERLLDHIRITRGFDLTGYKRATLRRRIGKRMADIGVDSYGQYIDQLEVSAGEFDALFNTVMINVSSFYRDPNVWRYVAEHVIPEILRRRGGGEPIRIWSAGCSTGEEPYTVAMLLAEQLGERGFADRVKVFATDVDEEALATARQGVYAAAGLEALPAELRDNYFEHADGRCSVSKPIRRSVIFGRNDLVRDAPISRLDLVTCRNTLMYFNGDTQRSIMTRLHLALAPEGFLVLGKSELLLTLGECFAPESLSLRVFRKRPGVRLRGGGPASLSRAPAGRGPEILPAALMDAFRVSPVAQLVLDASGGVAFCNRPMGELFGIGERELGTPIQDLELSYRPVELRSLIEQAAAVEGPIRSERVSWTGRDGAEHEVEVEVVALRGGLEQMGTSIAFIDVTRFARITSELERSKRELESAYEELQSTVEELETTNEELQSTNEELETTNEELQSTNEELETMNEELQSSNEELETMNEELRVRTEELNRVNLLVETMLSSLGMAVAVVDRELRVTVWNDLAKDTWGLDLHDVRDRRFLGLDIGLPVERLREPLLACVSGASGAVERVLEARDRRGVDVLCRVRCTPLSDGHGAVAGAIVIMEPSPS